LTGVMAAGLPASMAADYAESPIVPRPEGLALTVIVIAGVTMGLATIVVALKTYVRFPLTPGRSSRLG
jgi:hypothetical protein